MWVVDPTALMPAYPELHAELQGTNLGLSDSYESLPSLPLSTAVSNIPIYQICFPAVAIQICILLA